MVAVDAVRVEAEAGRKRATARSDKGRRLFEMLTFTSLQLKDSGASRATLDEIVTAFENLKGSDVSARERADIAECLKIHPLFESGRSGYRLK